MNPYDALGISRTSSKEDARRAYRKLAQKHHPDKGGSESKFKDIQAAWELIDGGWVQEPEPIRHTARPSSFTKPEPAWGGYYKPPPPRPQPAYTPHTNRYTPPSPPPVYIRPPSRVKAWELESRGAHHGEFVARTSIAEAYSGFICEIELGGKKIQIQMPKGIPNGLKNVLKVPGSNDEVTIITLFTQNVYNFQNVQGMKPEILMISGIPTSVYRVKDLWRTVSVQRKDIDRGITLDLEDFLGEKYKVKVPAGSDLRKPITVPGKGYVDWSITNSSCGSTRGDVFIRVNPTENDLMSHIR